MAAEALVKFKGDKKHLDNTVRSVKGDLRSLAKVGGAAVLGLGVATAAFGVSSVKSFASFDDAMNSSLAIMGDVDSTLKNDMRQSAMDLSSTMRISSTEAAEAYFFLASAGISAEDSIAALEVTATFAQAGMFDMALATDLLTDAQSALGLVTGDSAKDLENMIRVSDVFVKGNTLANATVQQFSEAITNKAGAALRGLGKDMEEGIAVLAAFADQGIKGQVAGTQLEILLKSLETASIKNGDAFAAAGIKVYDAQGNFRNIADVVADLETATSGLSDEAKKSLLLDLGLTDKSVASVKALLGTSDKIREYEEALRSSGGTAQEVSDKQAESFSAQMEIIGNRFENFKIRIGTRIAPKIIEAFDSIDQWWSANGAEISAKASELWADFERGSIIIANAWHNNVKPALSNWWEDFQVGWEIVSGVVSGLQSDFMKGFELLSIGAVVVFNVMQGLWNDFKEGWRLLSIGSVIVYNIMKGLWEDFQTGWANLSRGASVLWDWLVRLFSNGWEVLKGLWNAFKGWFDGDMRGWFDGLSHAFWAGWEIIKQLSSTAVRGIWLKLKNDWDNGVAQVKWLWGKLVEVFNGGWERVKTGVRVGFNKFANEIRVAGSAAYEAAKDVGSDIMRGLTHGISNPTGFIINLAVSIGNALKRFINENVINKINRGLEFDISFLGIKQSINPPDIPHLARGGVLDSPTLIVAGDSPGESEFVSPESKLREAFRDVASEMGGGSGSVVGTLNLYNQASPDQVVNAIAMAARTRRF